MCGRYTLTTPLDSLRQLFDFPESLNLAPRANIAPTQDVLVVRCGAEGARYATMLRWGLVPGWAKDLSIGARMINARAESLAEKPAFRHSFAKRRCLIPVDGFYEWQTRGQGPKQPFRVARSDRAPFAFAGLWERWRDRADAEAPAIESCTIVTAAANDLLRPIHHRMPVMLFDRKGFETWLDPSASDGALTELLAPRDLPALTAYPVSTRVNKVTNDDLSLIEPLPAGSSPEEGSDSQGSLF